MLSRFPVVKRPCLNLVGKTTLSLSNKSMTAFPMSVDSEGCDHMTLIVHG